MSETYFKHESAYVDEPVTIGQGTRIWHFCHIMSGAIIGEHCNLGQNVFVGGTARLGDNIKVQNNVSIYDGVEIEDDVFCGPSIVFTNVTNPRSRVNRQDKYLKTVVKRGASIGANATIVCGHTIGAYAFIGAGSVVTRDLPDFALAYGVPAGIYGWMCVCGLGLSFKPTGRGDQARCTTCERQYLKDGQNVALITDR